MVNKINAVYRHFSLCLVCDIIVNKCNVMIRPTIPYTLHTYIALLFSLSLIPVDFPFTDSEANLIHYD